MRNAILALLLLALSTNARAEVLSHWVQMVPGGTAQLRVVASDAACPNVTVNGKQASLQTRAEPDVDFARVCAITLTPNMKNVQLNGMDIPLPAATPKRIAVLGDTGCRIKDGTVQACNDPDQWPFLRVASEIAKLRPDLVIHVGDYLYRESKCPKDQASSCGNSPHGDNWMTWDADFFTPARQLLETAPIVLVRGNHEDCRRSGPGWFRLMGPDVFDPKTPCAGHIPPYVVPLGALNLVVMDDANAPDQIVDTAEREVYRQEFQNLSKLAAAPVWLAMHRPIAGAVRMFGFTVGGNRTLISALDDEANALSPVALMLSGHIHAFEAINYEGNRPPQLLAGNGGDKLDTASVSLANTDLGTWHVKDGISLPGFGFLLMTQQEKGWRIDVHGVDGAIERVCTFADRRLDCPGK
ncbi:MAG TPA: metallophosphoesterase [Rhizomicrobium sp.]|nr:metallophosphoesterase [Rhizomicrobium sp.]